MPRNVCTNVVLGSQGSHGLCIGYLRSTRSSCVDCRCTLHGLSKNESPRTTGMMLVVIVRLKLTVQRQYVNRLSEYIIRIDASSVRIYIKRLKCDGSTCSTCNVICVTTIPSLPSRHAHVCILIVVLDATNIAASQGLLWKNGSSQMHPQLRGECKWGRTSPVASQVGS